MNRFGKNFSISLFGESHGPVIGVTIDGVRPGLPLCPEDFEKDLLRRKSGAFGTTARLEKDLPHLVSGVFNGKTTGAPLTILFINENTRSQDYSQFMATPRPGHADYTARIRFQGYNDPRGGGMFSGRMTLGLVAAGVVAQKMLAQTASEQGVAQPAISARIIELGGVPDSSEEGPARWQELLKEAVQTQDSLGAIVECRAEGLPAGWGEPFFDTVESLIAHAIFSIPGVRGIEFGDGFEAARMKGSEHNDPLGKDKNGQIIPLKNGAGGVHGGLTNGNPLVFRTAFKPTSSIGKIQHTLNLEEGTETDLKISGRHDACFALRTPVIVEAVTAIVLADLMESAR